MKIKTDFVTNSSSTSYVMTSIVSGHLPVMGPYDELKKLEGPFKHSFIYDAYVHIAKEGSVEKAYEVSEPEYDLDLQLDNTIYHDDKTGNERSITIFTLKINLLNPCYNYIENVTKEYIEKILFEILKEKINATQLVYFAFPSSITGDGWDGGDPQGPSHDIIYKHDLYKAKTKTGILTIFDNKIISEITSIENALNLNEILLDNINTEGFSLEEHNDKNS